MHIMSQITVAVWASCTAFISVLAAPSALAAPTIPATAATIAPIGTEAGIKPVSNRDDRAIVKRNHNDDVEVDAPTTYVRTHRGRVTVEAPFTSVERSRSGVRVRAPFVDLWVPRR